MAARGRREVTSKNRSKSRRCRRTKGRCGAFSRIKIDTWVGTMSFAFDEGQCVNHKSGEMTSIVTGRETTAVGREHYRLWPIKPDERGERRRERWFLGGYLVATLKGGADCDGCSLREWCCPIV